MPSPLYDVLLICHVVAGFAGFGSIAVSGWAAAAGRRSGNPGGEERVVRFFRIGVDWPGRLIFAVPVLGLALLFGGHRGDAGAAWPWLGLGLWIVATGFASGVAWPAERRAQRELAAVISGDRAALAPFAEACLRVERAAAAVTVCFVLAVVVMIWQP